MINIEQVLCRYLTLSRIVFVFLLLVVVNLAAPFFADDFFQQLLLRGDAVLQRSYDGSLRGLYSFVSGSTDNRQQMIELGVLPWFAEPDFYFRFWRPITELSLLFDYRIAPSQAWFAHAHSIAWMLLLAVLVWRLSALLFPQQPFVALLAFAIFLWDGQHVASIHWIANRHILIAGVFVVASLLLFIRYSQGANFAALLLSYIFYGLGLLASETAVAVLAYSFFYLLIIDQRSFKLRLALFLPLFLITAVWYDFYQALGFGANTGKGLYINPIADWPYFILAVLERLPIYLVSLLLPAPAGFAWLLGMQWIWLFSVIAWVALFALAAWLYKNRRELFQYLSHDERAHTLSGSSCTSGLVPRDRLLLFLLLSAVASIVPICTSLPQDRLVLMPSIGVDIALAAVIVTLLQQAKYLLIAKALLIIHLILSPLHLLLGSWFMTFSAHAIEQRALNVEHEIKGKTVLALQVPIGEAVTWAGIRHFHGLDVPEAFYWMANTEADVESKPWDDYSFVLEKEKGFGSGFESAFGNHKSEPFYLDQVIQLNKMTIKVETLTANGKPQRIRVIFPQPLSEQSVVILEHIH